MQTQSDIFHQLLAQTSPYPIALEVERAEGSWIFSKTGKAYLDMISGVAVSNIGHRHPKVIEAIQQQLEKYLHVMVYGEFIQQPLNDLALQLQSVLPPQLNNFYYVNSGTEANEAALKLAKRVTGRTQIISCKRSYHGSTHGSLSVSGNETKKNAFRPLLPDVYFIEHNNTNDLQLITQKTACVIIEVIQGDAGVRIPSQGWMNALRQRCSETGAMLIFDEIQSGMGRTGTLFAFEHFGVHPDILTVGKAVAGGLPMGIMISRREWMQQFTHNPMLGHITTFGGNPLVCAAASACIEVLKNEIDFREVEAKGQYLEEKLKHPLVREIRRKGLMFAIDLDHYERVKKVVDYCLDKGVITFWFLSTDYAFRLAPPLNISYSELDKAIQIIQDGFELAQSELELA